MREVPTEVADRKLSGRQLAYFSPAKTTLFGGVCNVLEARSLKAPSGDFQPKK
jgi:hypothetical protein